MFHSVRQDEGYKKLQQQNNFLNIFIIVEYDLEKDKCFLHSKLDIYLKLFSNLADYRVKFYWEHDITKVTVFLI